LAQNPQNKTHKTGSHLDQHPGNKTRTDTSGHLTQNQNVKKGSSGSHTDQHPGNKLGNLTGSHLEPSVQVPGIERSSERGGRPLNGHVRSKRQSVENPGPKFKADRIA
jgi:hypothetical protein